MKAVLSKAIINEIRRELTGRLPSEGVPKTYKGRPGSLELAFPEAAYRLSIRVDNAAVLGDVSRLPHHDLAKEVYLLSDPTFFEAIAGTVCAQVRKDRVLIRVLDRVGRNLHDSLRRVMVVPKDWHISYYGPSFDGEEVSVWVTLQPHALRVAFSHIQYRLTLTTNRRGQFEAAIRTDDANFPTGSDKGLTVCGMDTPDSWRKRRSVASDLPRFTASAIRHIESFVLDRLLPIESVSAPQRARQAMLVLVPLRLAEAARENREVAWYQELVDACLFGLSCQPHCPRNVVWRLFFQLLQLELADRRHQSKAYAEYERLGLRLAGLRRVDETLPYNPVLAYDHHRNGRSNLDAKFSEQDRKTYSWFLNEVALEQVVDLLSFT